MSTEQITKWISNIKVFIKENKIKVGIATGSLVLIMLIGVTFFFVNNNPLIGTWKTVNGTNSIKITKDTLDIGSLSYTYKLSDDDRHIVLSNGGDSASTIPFSLKKDTLTFEGVKYYREGSSDYKSASSSSSRASSEAQKQYLSSSTKAAKLEANQTKLVNKYKKAYTSAQTRLTEDIAKQLNGKWQYSKTKHYDYIDYSDVVTKSISFDEKNKSLNYKKVSETKYDKETENNKNKATTEEGKATFKLNKIPSKYMNISNYGNDSELASSISTASSKEIKEAIAELKSVTLNNYFEKMHDLYGGYSDESDTKFSLSLSDTTGDLHNIGSTLYINFPKSDSNIKQISFTSSFSDDDDYTKVQ